MKEIKAYIRNEMLDIVLDAIAALPNSPAVTVVQVRGFGHPSGGGPLRGAERTKLEIVVPDDQVERVVDCLLQHARTGSYGDGKIFVLPVETAARIRTGERGDNIV